MKKLIEKHIKNIDFVKVYLSDNKTDSEITHFEGYIFEQNKKFIIMNDMYDFTYDGLVIVKKSDISEIKHTKNEKFFTKILAKENIKKSIINTWEQRKISLQNIETIFTQIQSLQIPVILECQYGNDDRFIIGPIEKIGTKKVKVKYFNAQGEYDFKPVSAEYKDITVIRFDSPYANIFYKYAKDRK